jgi:hypothetical protein
LHNQKAKRTFPQVITDTELERKRPKFTYEEFSSSVTGVEEPSKRTKLIDLTGGSLVQVSPIPGSIFEHVPDVGRPCWIEKYLENNFLHCLGLNSSTAVSKIEDLIDPSARPLVSVPDKLIAKHGSEDILVSDGKFMLRDVLMTSYNHGRTKRRELLLFQDRLVFLRKKDDISIVLWDLSLRDDVILVTYLPNEFLRRTDTDARVLCLY